MNADTSRSTSPSTTLPPNYYHELLKEALASNSTLNSRRIPNTNIFEIEDPRVSDSPIRVGSLTSMLPLSKGYETVFDILMPISAYLAVQDFNNRISAFLDQESLNTARDCNFYLSMTFRDTATLQNVAATEFMEQFMNQLDDTQVPSFASIGPVFSDLAASVATLAGATTPAVITMSPSSGSELLENRAAYPYFARTHAHSLGRASALVAYLHSIGVHHLVILHVANDYGRGYLNSVTRAAQKYGIQLHVTSYHDDDPSSMAKAIQLIQQFPTNYHMCISTGGKYQDIVLQLYDNNLIGPQADGRAWFFTGNVRDARKTQATIGQEDRLDQVQRALDGAVTVATHLGPYTERVKTLLILFQQDKLMQQAFLDQQVSGIFVNNSEAFYDKLYEEDFPFMGGAGARSYDAVWAMGLAACQTQTDEQLMTPQLYETLKNLSFHGADGQVKFLETATRDPVSILYRLANLRYHEDGNATSLTDHECMILSQDEGVVEVIEPIIFPGNTTDFPPPLKPIQVDTNQASRGLRAFCWALAALVMLASLACAVWTLSHRHSPRVRASQPAFLVLLCAGTFLIGGSISPWTWQEPLSEGILSIGCMLEMWMLAIGFSTTFATLFARTWRIREVLARANAFQRTALTAGDVIWGPLAVITLNAVLLTIWTVMDPLEWTRVVASQDYFDRPLESYGTCFEFENHGIALASLWAIVAINVFVILTTAVQAQRSRFLPSQYNERNHLAIASFLMLEATLLGIPILLASGKRDPSALMAVGSWIFAISAFAVLLPMFVPKIGIESGWIEDKNPMHGPEFQASLSKSMRRLRRSTAGSSNNITRRTSSA